MKISLDDIDDLRDAFIGLDHHERDQSWSHLSQMVPAHSAGTVPFFGGVVQCIPTQKDAEQTLFLRGPVSDQVRGALLALSQGSGLAIRGASTPDMLYFYWGPDIGTGQFFVTSHSCAAAMLHDTFPGANLTPAEVALILDLLVGHDLRQTATRDGLSYETKRTLLKRALQKTGFHKQADLVSRLCGTFVALVDAAQAQVPTDDFATIRAWHRDCCVSDVKLHSLFDAQGELHHILEAGAKDGQCIIGLMPSFLAYVGTDHVARLREQKIRLLMPLRPGTVAPQSPRLDPDTFERRVLTGVGLAYDMHGASKVTVMGVSNAAGFAARFAARHADQVDQLILASPLLSRVGADHPVDRFRRAFHRIANRAPRLQAAALSYLQRIIADEQRFRRVLLRLSHGLDTDKAVIMAELEDSRALRFYHQYAMQSLPLMLTDTTSSLMLTRADLKGVTSPITVIAGEQDEVTPPEEMAACFADCQDLRTISVPQTGHVFRGPNLHRLIDAISGQD